MTLGPAAAYWAARLALLQERGGAHCAVATFWELVVTGPATWLHQGLDYDSGSFSQSLRGGESVGEGFGGLQREPLVASQLSPQTQAGRA